MSLHKVDVFEGQVDRGGFTKLHLEWQSDRIRNLL